jgi:GNAT superfamily N-acetyltransferase
VTIFIMEFKIIRAEPHDWRTFAELRLHYLRAEPAAYGSDYAREVGFGAELWQERLAANWSFLAYPAGDPAAAPVGTATGFWLGDGDMLVVAMYVAPGARRAGCAHRLLDRIAEVARHREGRRLLLDVTDLESAAGRCYAAYGFTETGSRRPMDRDPSLTEIRLAFDL